ncbi:ArgE/DapE family deacylase [Phreatobacter sp. AB_2022a]|uniref:ArgE/DapE family deacylase n=1 Tax=Phreatobacter sp. AB_2022a TaxID=3003134 RepID=UPI002286D298|nr:ArgE/DapE family deacylase [Phreatobacter sp. AB_2022a]MCZ0733896.1 ArgE/DapE family deacylase [Phreatobacter sp. AB_2022a]
MSLDAALAAKILKAVDDNFDRQMALTADLVRFASQRGAEGPCQDFVQGQMEQRGWVIDRFAMDEAAIGRHPGGSPFAPEHSKAPIVVGIHRPKQETGRSLILQSHVDVVPPGPASMWTRPAFEPHIEGDWFYGRGGADMKAGHAAMFAVFDALKTIGLQPASTVTVQSVVEEEATGNGALQCHLRGYRADAVLIPEPEEEKLIRANAGVLWFRVEVAGLPVHVSHAGSGQNAIEAAFGLIAALRGLEADWNAKKGEHALFADDPHPINLNIGKIEGGDWASSVPAWCSFDCRIAIYPGERPEAMQRAVEATIQAASRNDRFLSNNPPRVVWNGFTTEGYVLEPGSEAEATLGRAHEAATGKPLETMVTPAYLDTRVYALYDQVPALCYGPISENIHGFDERFSVASMRRVTRTMALFVAEWCGVEPI